MGGDFNDDDDVEDYNRNHDGHDDDCVRVTLNSNRKWLFLSIKTSEINI